MVKKIESIEKNSNINFNDIDSSQKISIKINTENLLKKVIEIPILIQHIVSVTDGTLEES